MSCNRYPHKAMDWLTLVFWSCDMLASCLTGFVEHGEIPPDVVHGKPCAMTGWLAGWFVGLPAGLLAGYCLVRWRAWLACCWLVG